MRSERSTVRFPRSRFQLVCKGQQEVGREGWPPTVGVRSHFECAGPGDGDVDGSQYVNSVLAVGLMEHHSETRVVGDTDVEIVGLVNGITPQRR